MTFSKSKGARRWTDADLQETQRGQTVLSYKEEVIRNLKDRANLGPGVEVEARWNRAHDGEGRAVWRLVLYDENGRFITSSGFRYTGHPVVGGRSTPHRKRAKVAAKPQPAGDLAAVDCALDMLNDALDDIGLLMVSKQLARQMGYRLERK